MADESTPSMDREHGRPALPTQVVGKSVLERTAVLLTCFGDGITHRTLKELCEHTGLPKSTVHRFAERLVELGWLERSASGYAIGIGLYEIGNLANQDFRLRSVALPYLQRLAAATRCAAQLAVVRDDEVEYLEIVPYRGFHPPAVEGGRMPVHCTALGKAIIAFSTDSEIDRVLSKPSARRTVRTLTTRAQLLAEFARIRQDGVAHDDEECVNGLSCVAAPIRRDGPAIAAISASAPPDTFDPAHRISEVRRCASALWDGLLRAGVVGPRGHAAAMVGA